MKRSILALLSCTLLLSACSQGEPKAVANTNRNNNSSSLKSESGVDYSHLQSLMAEGKWLDADTETRELMLQVAGLEGRQNYLDRQSIDNLPCEDLRTIDQLWVTASNGIFGFSIQKKIWIEAGGKIDYNYDNRREEGIQVSRGFSQRIGWRTETGSKKIIYSLNAPVGHLPYLYYHHSIIRGWGPGRFFSRVQSCEL